MHECTHTYTISIEPGTGQNDRYCDLTQESFSGVKSGANSNAADGNYQIY